MVQAIQDPHSYIGLASDQKPEATPGSTYHAVDTGDEWVYYDGMWTTDLRKVDLVNIDNK